jgi:Winged helix-turn helix
MVTQKNPMQLQFPFVL